MVFVLVRSLVYYTFLFSSLCIPIQIDLFITLISTHKNTQSDAYIHRTHILAIKTFIHFSSFIIFYPSVFQSSHRIRTTYIKRKKIYEKYKTDEKEKDFKSKQRKIDSPQQKHRNHVSNSNMWNIQQSPNRFASDIQKYYEH